MFLREAPVQHRTTPLRFAPLRAAPRPGHDSEAISRKSHEALIRRSQRYDGMARTAAPMHTIAMRAGSAQRT
jgi:hypothetical protein